MQIKNNYHAIALCALYVAYCYKYVNTDPLMQRES